MPVPGDKQPVQPLPCSPCASLLCKKEARPPLSSRGFGARRPKTFLHLPGGTSSAAVRAVPPVFWLTAVRNSQACRICPTVPAPGCNAGQAPAAPPCARSRIYTTPWGPRLDKQRVTATTCSLGDEGGAAADSVEPQTSCTLPQLVLRGPLWFCLQSPSVDPLERAHSP